MGKPTSRSKSGLYAMKGPKDAIPQMARNFDPASAPALGCDGCEPVGADKYQRPADNLWTRVLAEPLSTFSIDVDTASYSNVRRFILGGSSRPPPPCAPRSWSITSTTATSRRATGAPFRARRGRPVPVERPTSSCTSACRARSPASRCRPRNLVFLVDVSGSMEAEDKLPLLQASASHAGRRHAGQRDRISIVVYAGASGLVLAPTSGTDKDDPRALDNLEAGGSTNGGAGITLAYAQARKHFIQGGVNRVVLATDGDFNVGVTTERARQLIEQAQVGRVPVRARLRPRQPQRPHDGAARRQGQRQLRLHRLRTRGHARSSSPRPPARSSPSPRTSSCRSSGTPPPSPPTASSATRTACSPPRTSRTTQGRRRARRGPQRHRHLRGRPRRHPRPRRQARRPQVPAPRRRRQTRRRAAHRQAALQAPSPRSLFSIHRLVALTAAPHRAARPAGPARPSRRASPARRDPRGAWP
jgi:hypothetical protein